jgi:hypothetical protein
MLAANTGCVLAEPLMKPHGKTPMLIGGFAVFCVVVAKRFHAISCRKTRRFFGLRGHLASGHAETAGRRRLAYLESRFEPVSIAHAGASTQKM